MEENKAVLKCQPVPKRNCIQDGDTVIAKSASKQESKVEHVRPAKLLENQNAQGSQTVNEFIIKQEYDESNAVLGIENEERAITFDNSESRENNGLICETEYSFLQGTNSLHDGAGNDVQYDNEPNEYFVISEIDLGEEANSYLNPIKIERIEKAAALRYIDRLRQYALQNDLLEIIVKLNEIESLIKLTAAKKLAERRAAHYKRKNQHNQQEVFHNDGYAEETDSVSQLTPCVPNLFPVAYASYSGQEYDKDDQNFIISADLNGENTILPRKKSQAERMREYRARKKERKLREFQLNESQATDSTQNNNTSAILSRKKTQAERMREYRARKKQRKLREFQLNESQATDSTQNNNTSAILSRKKTQAERMREYRNRKKLLRLRESQLNESNPTDTNNPRALTTANSVGHSPHSDSQYFGNIPNNMSDSSLPKRTAKLKKTAAERMREYRARKKMLAQQAALENSMLEEDTNFTNNIFAGFCGDPISINSLKSNAGETFCANEHIPQDISVTEDHIAVNESAYLCEASISDFGDICKIKNTSQDSLGSGLNTFECSTVQKNIAQNFQTKFEQKVLFEENHNTCDLLTPLVDHGLSKERSSKANQNFSKDDIRRQRCAARVRRWREKKKLEKLATTGN